ncbi:MAG: single-stranded DNA-binding protein [Candidatus Pacebacteria bacterium]|nr:single-stranded DNA-binding protein [Candidatus Paceibacterota bacterium]
MYLNKVILIGNLTRDPELKALPSGTKVCSFSIATNRNFKDKDGNRQEAVEFHNVVVFGRVAELVGQYLKKGSQAYVEGRLQTRSWEQNNEKKYRTEIVAETVQFGNRPGAGGNSGPTGSAPSGAKVTSPAPGESGEKIDYPAEEINPDDIPF